MYVKHKDDQRRILHSSFKSLTILTRTSSTLPSTTFPIPKNKVAKHTTDAETKVVELTTFRVFIIASEEKSEVV